MINNTNKKNKYIAIRGGMLTFLQRQRYPKSDLLRVDWETFINNLQDQKLTKAEFLDRLTCFIYGINDYLDIHIHISDIEKILTIGIVDLILFEGRKYIDPRFIIERNTFLYTIDEDDCDVSIVIKFLFDIYKNDYDKRKLNLVIVDLSEDEHDFIKNHLLEYLDDHAILDGYTNYK